MRRHETVYSMDWFRFQNPELLNPWAMHPRRFNATLVLSLSEQTGGRSGWLTQQSAIVSLTLLNNSSGIANRAFIAASNKTKTASFITARVASPRPQD
jgi:hypothetical protein